MAEAVTPMQRVGAAFSLICMAAYFVERLGFADLPGIPGDYMVAGWLILAAVMFARRSDQAKDEGSADG